jgi:uncharacterized repeat protein (TIGR01451 family)
MTASGTLATLALEKRGPAAVPFGKPLRYEILVRNVGPVAAHQVHLEEELPFKATFLSAEPRPEVRGDRLSWRLGDLEPGGERKIQVEVQPGVPGEAVSTATVALTAPAGLRTQVSGPPLSLTVSSPEAVAVGQATALQIKLTNNTATPLSGVMLRVRLADGLHSAFGKDVEAPLNTLAPGATRTATLQLTAAQPGRGVNEVSVATDEGVQASAQAPLLITEAAPAGFPGTPGPGPAGQLMINR